MHEKTIKSHWWSQNKAIYSLQRNNKQNAVLPWWRKKTDWKRRWAVYRQTSMWNANLTSSFLLLSWLFCCWANGTKLQANPLRFCPPKHWLFTVHPTTELSFLEVLMYKSVSSGKNTLLSCRSPTASLDAERDVPSQTCASVVHRSVRAC